MFKRGGVYWLKIRCNGMVIQKSLETSNRKLAKAIEAKIRSDLVEGRFFDGLEGKSKTFSDLASKYLEEQSILKAPRSQERDEAIFRLHLVPAFGSKTLNGIRPRDISSYKAKRRAARAKAETINKELGLMKAAFNVAIKEWEWIRDNPVSRVRMEKTPRGRVRYLSEKEAGKLCKALPDWLKPIVTVARFTGLRMSNVLGLEWSQVDFSRRLIIVEETKNGERLSVPVCETLYDTLLGLRKVRALKSDRVFVTELPMRSFRVIVRRAFLKACREAGIENFRWHDLRHDFASMLVQNGVDLYTVQRLLGHKDGRMTQRYAHLAPENLVSAVKTLDSRRCGYSLATVG